MKTAAEGHGVPVFQFARMRDLAAINAFATLEAHLGVMAFVTDIVPDALLEAPSKGTIQYHPSLLPKHRGPSSINWPIVQGEKETGLTIFWPDKGLDTGPVLLQKTTTIEPDDTLGSLYFGKLFALGVEALVEAIEMVRNGTAPRTEQDESQATYESWCKAEDLILDWTRPVDVIYNTIRGGDPSPGAGTTFRGSKLRLYSAKKNAGDAGKTPGEVVAVTDDGFTVAALGGQIQVGRVQPEDSKKIAAAEWIEAVGLEIGMKLGN